MAERFKAHAWKVCVLLKVPRVRIPVSPPKVQKPFINEPNLIIFCILTELIFLFFFKNVIII